MQLVSARPSAARSAALSDYVTRHCPDFLNLLDRIPIPSGVGTISASEAFWLWRLALETRPAHIVESGTATGWSAWLVGLAAPNSRLTCFDTNRVPDSLPPNATFVKKDWASRPMRLPPGSLTFFDDHVNHRIRLRQACRAGAEYAVFHDNYEARAESVLSLRFCSMPPQAEFVHTFEPLWHCGEVFRAPAYNADMYRWLTLVKLSAGRQTPAMAWRRRTATWRVRNPLAPQATRRRNWGTSNE